MCVHGTHTHLCACTHHTHVTSHAHVMCGRADAPGTCTWHVQHLKNIVQISHGKTNKNTFLDLKLKPAGFKSSHKTASYGSHFVPCNGECPLSLEQGRTARIRHYRTGVRSKFLTLPLSSPECLWQNYPQNIERINVSRCYFCAAMEVACRFCRCSNVSGAPLSRCFTFNN